MSFHNTCACCGQPADLSDDSGENRCAVCFGSHEGRRPNLYVCYGCKSGVWKGEAKWLDVLSGVEVESMTGEPFHADCAEEFGPEEADDHVTGAPGDPFNEDPNDSI